VLSRFYRRLFLTRLQAAFEAGQLRFFGDLASLATPAAFAARLRPLHTIRWVVYAKRPFGGPEQVLEYLGRYTHCVAIANSRLISLAESRVSFRWKDYRHHDKQKVMTLGADEFIRRFCWSKPDSNCRSHPLTRSRSLGGAGASGSARQDRRRHREARNAVCSLDELGRQFPGMPDAPSHGQNRLRARDRLRRLRASGGALFAFSAKTRSVGTIAFVVKANAKKWPRADSLMREKIFLIARFNSLQGPKKFPVRMRRELAYKH
jgi:putative transposase